MLHQTAEPFADGITLSNFLFHPRITPELSTDSLPVLPPETQANVLFETTYRYIQARYTLVDWVQVHHWQQQREKVCCLMNSNEAAPPIGICLKSTLDYIIL